MNDLKEITTSEKTIFEGKIITVKIRKVKLPNGGTSVREIVHHNGGVTILVVDDEYTYLVEQFRNPAQTVLYELPAGKLEKGEDPKAAALREVNEEVGIVANDIIELGYIYSTPGFCDEKIYMYAVTDFRNDHQNLDQDEFLNLKRVKISDLVAMIRDGLIVDGKTISCLYKYLQL